MSCINSFFLSLKQLRISIRWTISKIQWHYCSSSFKRQTNLFL